MQYRLSQDELSQLMEKSFFHIQQPFGEFSIKISEQSRMGEDLCLYISMEECQKLWDSIPSKDGISFEQEAVKISLEVDIRSKKNKG